MRRFPFLILMLLGTSPGILAEPISDQTFAQYNSAFMEVVKPDSSYAKEQRPSFPVWSRPMGYSWLQYDPNPEADAKTADCSSQKWFDENREAGASPGGLSITDSIEHYVHRCDQQIQSGWKFTPITSYLALMVKFNSHQDPYGRFVVFHLPNGNQLKGFLALKGDGTKRPLVIVRLGIFANVNQFATERFMFMQLFEQSPFNVLMLESNSGREFIVRNKTLAVGGFDEGIQDFQIAKRLQDPSEPLSKIVDGVHMEAISMGGHGALFASLLSDWIAKSSPTAKPVLQSVLAYCPLINFRDSMDFHMVPGADTTAFNYWVSNRLRGISEIIPGLNEEHFVESLATWVEKNYKGPVAYDESVPLNAKMKEDLKKYWDENQFWTHYKDVQTPVLIFATRTDTIVPYALNAERILNKYMDLGNSQLRLIPLEAGFHCDLPGSYQWRPFASFAQAFVLRNSDFKPEAMSRELQMSTEEVRNMKAKAFPPHYELQKGKNESEFFLNLQISDQPLIVRSLPFSFKDMGFADSNFESSQTMILRWLAQNLRFSMVENTGNPSKLILSWYR